MGCCQRCSEIRIQDASEQGKNLLKLGAKKALTTGKTLAIKGKDVAISKAKDLVTECKHLAVKKAQDLTQKALTKGVAATQNALSKGQDLVTSKVRQIARRIDPIGTLDKVKTLTSNPQVQKVMQKHSNELINSHSCASLSNIIAGSGLTPSIV